MRDSSIMTRCYAIAILIVLVAGWASKARAQPAQSPAFQQIDIHGGSGGHRIGVHPAFVTVLYFPTPIVNVLHSDTRNFTVQAKRDRIVLRPSEHAKPGTVANLNVLTDTLKLSIILVVVERPEQATSQVVFREPTPSPGWRLLLSMGGILGVAFQDHMVGTSRSSTSLFMGPESHLMLLKANDYGLDVSLALAQLQIDHLDAMVQASPDDLPFVQSTILTRVLVGISSRFGQRMRPRVHFGAGAQVEIPVDRRVDLGRGDRAIVQDSAPLQLDLLLTTGTSIDMTIARHWRAGVGVRVTRTLYSGGSQFLSIESSLFIRWL
jgi:hypothetical protein